MISLFTISESDSDNSDAENETAGSSGKKKEPRVERCVISHVCLSNCEVIPCKGGEKVSIELTQEGIEKRIQPELKREGFDHVAFAYEGFLVRIRKGVPEFLAWANEHFDVILFTAAEKQLYTGLLIKLEKRIFYLLSKRGIKGSKAKKSKLWSNVYYRDSCDLSPLFHLHPAVRDSCQRNIIRNNHHGSGGPHYYLKNLSKLRRSLSKIIILDNNIHMFRTFEPNSISCKDYVGKRTPDSEVLSLLYPLSPLFFIFIIYKKKNTLS